MSVLLDHRGRELSAIPTAELLPMYRVLLRILDGSGPVPPGSCACHVHALAREIEDEFDRREMERPV